MPAGEMDPVYSIGVNNRFIGIDSDIIDDPLELIRAAQEKPKKEKEVKTKGKKDVKPVKGHKEKPVKIESPTETETPENKRNDRPRSERGRGRGRGGRGRGGERGRGRGGNRGGFNTSPSDQNGGFDNNNSSGFRGGFNDNNNQTDFYGGGFNKSPVTETQNEGFGSGSGFGGGFSGGFGNSFNDNEDERRGGRSGFRGSRGGRGGRGRGRGGNREFDRRSGSDKSSVKAVDKREGSGSYNWGTPQDELAASEEQTGGFGIPKEPEDTPVETTEQTTETEETAVEEKQDEGPQQITFDEWKKQQSEMRSKPQHNIRKVESEKKGMKQLKKPTEEENEADGSLFFPKKYYEEKFKTSGRVRETMNLDITYGTGDNRHLDTSRRGGRGRSGRGRSGGKRDEGGFGSNKSAEIPLENTEEFPSLG